ncbi:MULTISPECIES: phage tail protein [unclassified Microcoleus]|uniref:phage tail protein n=1 Tax=unclassified Microcoleus TaxID=2642155 RepID=UPI002FD5C0F6
MEKTLLNVGLSFANSLTGIRFDPYNGSNFYLEIEGLITGGFSEITGLESEIEFESYQEGGVNGYSHQFPRRTRYPNLVLSHGLTSNDTLWTWYQSTTQGNIQLKNVTIILLTRQQIPVMLWNFKNAYPVKWSGPTFNASNATEVAVERLELIHQGIDKPVTFGPIGLGINYVTT